MRQVTWRRKNGTGKLINTRRSLNLLTQITRRRLAHGDNLGEALEKTLTDLDGFFTFVVGTKNGFGVVRDPIACKPAVMAETDDWVAMASEYRAIAVLPGADDARMWEPEPGRVYSWERQPA